MSGATVEAFIGYWQTEGEHYARRGDYDWMASLAPPGRVLEIGCGVGFGTAALVRRGLSVLAVDSLPQCLAATRQRLGEGAGQADFLLADVAALDDAARRAINDFAPNAVVCWLMGAPADVTGAFAADAGQAVAAYREKIHRAVAELAALLPGVAALHLVDRTAIPWQGKDIARDTLVRYHLGKTLLDLPFEAARKNALYRKLEDKVVDLDKIRRAHPALKSVVPALASLLAERKK